VLSARQSTPPPPLSASATAAEGGVVNFSVSPRPDTKVDTIEWTVDGMPVAAARGHTNWQFSPGATANANYEIGLHAVSPTAPQRRKWMVTVEAATGLPARVEEIETIGDTAAPTASTYLWVPLAVVAAAVIGCSVLFGRRLVRRLRMRHQPMRRRAMSVRRDHPSLEVAFMANALRDELHRRAGAAPE
jgi:hypothetical protein